MRDQASDLPIRFEGVAFAVGATSILRDVSLAFAPGALTAVLAGFGRAIAEVGAVIIVGGNIAGVTRTMTTSIALETSRGDLPLALGLGIVLITLTALVNAAAFVVGETARRVGG